MRAIFLNAVIHKIKKRRYNSCKEVGDLIVYCNRSSGVFNAGEIPPDAGLALFGFNGLKKISYKNELQGVDGNLSEFALLTKKTDRVLLTGAITDNYGIIKRSAIIAERGKLLGISDMNVKIDPSGYGLGGGRRVYQTIVGRIGVLISDDLIDFEGVKAMSLCDADLIVAILPEGDKPQYDFIVRAYAYLFGVPIVLICESGVMAADMNGEICGASREGEATLFIPAKKNYRTLSLKRRGVK